MAGVSWQLSGEYFDACSGDSVCPCLTSGMAARPTKGSCDVGLVFQVQRGRYGSTSLDGLSFAVLARTPGQIGRASCRERVWSSVGGGQPRRTTSASDAGKVGRS